MPHARILSAFEGHPAGRILVATLGDDPAAGAEISLTIPGRSAWRVRALHFTLVTSATVANRRTGVEIDDGQNTFVTIAPASVQTASLTRVSSYFEGGDRAADDTIAFRHPLPTGLVMLPGWRLRTATINLQVDDNYSAPVLYVTEIPERGEGVWDELARAVAREIIDRRALDA